MRLKASSEENKSEDLYDIDVVMPFHRDDMLLKIAIKSLENSIGVNLRLIAIDDRKDKTSKIDFQSKLEIIILESNGLGYSKALNVGLDFLRTERHAEFIGFLDSDDLTHPNRFREQIEILLSTKAHISCTELIRINSNGKLSFIQPVDCLSNKNSEIALLLGSFAANSSWVITSKVLNDREFLNPNYVSIDWESALRTFSRYKIIPLKKPYYAYRRHSLQMTKTDNYKNAVWDSIYVSWAFINQKYSLPILSPDSAASIAAPWLTNSKKKYTNANWQKQLLTRAKFVDKSLYKELKWTLNYRKLQYKKLNRLQLNLLDLLHVILEVLPIIAYRYGKFLINSKWILELHVEKQN